MAPGIAGAVDWDRQIRQHNPRVILSLVAMGLPWGHAAEHAHAAWARLIERHAAGAVPVIELPGLAIAQARFLVLEERRQAAARRAVEAAAGPTTLVQLPDPGPNPETRAGDRQRIARVLAAVDRAPLPARRVFQLVYGGNRSHAETATAVGLSLQRVRQILCELRQAARAAVDEEEP
jgi:RNA polymerase sigma-70 factor (ECF subfamily)